MTNKETLQEYNTRLSENNNSLNTVLSMINELPEASGGDEEMDIYSTEEVKTNKVWIDGRPIYRKVIDCGALPNASEKSIPHNISNLDFFTNASAMAYHVVSESPNYIVEFFLPLPTTTSVQSNIYFLAASDNVLIGTGSDRTNYTKCYVTLEYIKTTDTV